MKHKSTGEYTLSFRSTEFSDDDKGGDWSRDGVAGADGEMLSYGFALAQIADMQAWFLKLRQDGVNDPARGLPPGALYNVTGYSLGGHLATVFTEANKDDPSLKHAYLFNSPGRGGLPNGVSMAQFVTDVYSRMNAAGLVLLDGTRTTVNGRLFQGHVYTDTRYSGFPGDDVNRGIRGEIFARWLPSAASLINDTAGAIEANSLITNIIGTTDYEDITVTTKLGNRTSNIQKVFIEDQPLVEGAAFEGLDSILFKNGRGEFGTCRFGAPGLGGRSQCAARIKTGTCRSLRKRSGSGSSRHACRTPASTNDSMGVA